MEKNPKLRKLTLLLVSSLTIMSVITISPALPQMAQAFEGLPNVALLVRLVLTIPALMIAVVSPIAGRLIDRYGRLRLLWLSLLVYAAAGTAGYFLDNLYYILGSRALLGMAVGMSMTIVITLVADYFTGQERQQFVGIQVAFMSIGGILFIGLGGMLADLGWRYPFLMYFFSLLVFPLSILFLNEPAPVQRAMEQGIKVQAPPVIWVLFFNTMLMWIIFFLIPVQIPFHLKALGVEKNAMIGAAIAVSTASSAVSSFFYSRLKGRFNFPFLFSLGYLFMAAGFACVFASGAYGMVVLAMVLSGLGMGMMIPNTNMWVMKVAPPEVRGREIGKLTTFWFLGQFLSPIVLFPVLNVLSLPAAFLAAAVLLLCLSGTFLVFYFSRARFLYA